MLLDPALKALAKTAPKRRVLFFTYSAGYQHGSIKRNNGELSHAEKVLIELGTSHGFEVTATKDGALFTADNLKSYDVIFFYTTGDLTQLSEYKEPPMSVEGKKAHAVLGPCSGSFAGPAGYHRIRVGLEPLPAAAWQLSSSVSKTVGGSSGRRSGSRTQQRSGAGWTAFASGLRQP